MDNLVIILHSNIFVIFLSTYYNMTSIPFNKFLNNIVKNIDSNNYLNEIKYTGGTKEEDLKKLIKKMKKNFKTIQEKLAIELKKLLTPPKYANATKPVTEPGDVTGDATEPGDVTGDATEPGDVTGSGTGPVTATATATVTKDATGSGTGPVTETQPPPPTKIKINDTKSSIKDIIKTLETIGKQLSNKNTSNQTTSNQNTSNQTTSNQTTSTINNVLNNLNLSSGEKVIKAIADILTIKKKKFSFKNMLSTIPNPYDSEIKGEGNILTNKSNTSVLSPEINYDCKEEQILSGDNKVTLNICRHILQNNQKK
jgi:hypothetical protein